MEEVFEIGIIGLGPAGHKAAKEALKFGFSVICFEKEKTGGTCLNVGCIPTKAILHATDILKEMKNLTKEGVLPLAEAEFDFKQIYSRKNKIVEKLSTAVEKDLAQKGAKIVKNKASFNKTENGFLITAEGTEYKVQKLIVATGSEPFELPDLKFDGKKILNSNDILELEEIPKSLVIVGSGAIGIEWARIFSTLGAKVTVVEKAENLLPTADIDVSKRIARMFKISGIQAYTETTVTAWADSTATLSNGKTAEAEKILVAAGRKRVWPESSLNRDEIAINADGSTNIKDLFVIGDVMAKKMLAHTAGAQAVRVVELIKTGKTSPVHDEEIPSIIYGTPEIAEIGLCEQDLPENYRENPEYKIYNFRIMELPKAWCDGDLEGFIKIITKSEKILGAHIISKEASALITQVQIAMKAEMSVETLKTVVFAHPTYSEGILEAVCQ